MLPALGMQRAVHQQVGIVGPQCFALLGGLSGDHWRAQHQVGQYQRRLAVIEGEHIGGVVFVPVIPVQGLGFFVVNNAHRDLGVALQCLAQPACHLVPQQCRAVQRRLG